MPQWMKWAVVALCLSLSALPGQLYAQAQEPQAQAPAAWPLVVVTDEVLADLARQVGGDGFRFVSLLDSTDDSDAYVPSQTAVQAVAKAKLVIIHGLGKERRWLNNLLDKAGYEGLVVNASSDIPRILTRNGTSVPAKTNLERKNEYQGQKIDTRAWMDPANVRVYIKNITDGFVAADPSHAKDYQTRRMDFTKGLSGLDAWARQSFSGIGQDYRRVVVAFDRFQYVAKAYGLEVQPLSDSRDTLLSSAKLQELKNRMKIYKVRGIVAESDAALDSLEEFAKATDARVFGPVTTGNIRGLGQGRSDYDAMMRQIFTAFYQAMLLNGRPDEPAASKKRR